MSARITSGADSRQTYGTPPEFIAAVERRFGPIVFDLAADASNAKAKEYFDEATDALKQDWAAWYTHIGYKLAEAGLPNGILWLNPPFADIKPWAEKCRAEGERGARIAFLVPASVGSRWFANNVFGRARVFFLLSRLCFDGKNVFPKDCMLCLFGPAGTVEPGFELWDWRRGGGL